MFDAMLIHLVRRSALFQLRYYNMKDPNADRGVITMGVNASLCLVSELKPFTQYNVNMTVLGLDEIGDEITSLSLQFTFYTKATGKI